MTGCGLILLAAGASTRLQQPKQLLPYQDKNLLQHSIQTALAAPVSFVMVVSGAYAGPVLEPHDDRLEFVANSDWKEGMGSSIRCGLSVFLTNHPETERIILMVCDQPFVSATLLQDLVEKSTKENKHIVACSYGNTIGTPVLFTKKFFSRLAGLKGDEGAKKIVLENMDQTVVIPFPEGEIDIDTMQDYENLVQNHS